MKNVFCKYTWSKIIILQIIFLFQLFFLVSCNHSNSIKDRVIILQPFSDIETKHVEMLFSSIKKNYPKTFLRPPTQIPESCLNDNGYRYRADKLLKFLQQKNHTDTTVIALTSKDISTSKGNIKDWGIMGLAYCPGNVCVVSTFRLSKKNIDDQFYKVAIHEIGHSFGLKHCSKNLCFMRDAKGSNPLNEENDFCRTCKTFLINKGMKLSSFQN